MTTTTTLWKRAVERYVDKDKPEPIRRRQIESWIFEWNDDKNVVESTTRTDEEATSSTSGLIPLFVPDHRIAGTLTWMGEYVTIQLQSMSYWKDYGNNNDIIDGGSFAASCTAKAFLRDDLDAKQLKLQQKLMKRWKTKTMNKDTPVINLLDRSVDLFEVFIVPSEERVHWKEETCTAIQQLLYTTAESALEVFEFIVNLPIIPQSIHDCDDRREPLRATTKLADRAVLRLLEDAAYDACEAEDSDDEEIVEELSLDDHDHDGDDETTKNYAKNHLKKRLKRGF